jgi:hypothetical protein
MRRSTEISPLADAGFWSRLSPLAREIVVILIVKAIVLSLLWYAFFRAPSAPRMKMDPAVVEQKFLAPAPGPENSHVVR